MSLQATMHPTLRAASVAKRHGRVLTPAIRAYKADPSKQHHHEEAAKKKEEHHLEKKKPAAESSAVAHPRQPTRASTPMGMMMSPLLGSSSLGAFFPPSALSMLRQMDSMFANDPFFARSSALFENDPFFAPAHRASASPSSAALAAAAPAASPQLLPLDISESDDAYTIKADLPGVDKSDVTVQVSPDGQYLTISGQRSEERREGGGEGPEAAEGAADAEAPQSSLSRPLRVERRWSSWSRSLALSPDVDVDSVKASLKDGVLRVQLPKLPPAKEEEEAEAAPKTIAVE